MSKIVSKFPKKLIQIFENLIKMFIILYLKILPIFTDFCRFLFEVLLIFIWQPCKVSKFLKNLILTIYLNCFLQENQNSLIFFLKLQLTSGNFLLSTKFTSESTGVGIKVKKRKKSETRVANRAQIFRKFYKT